MSSKSEKDKTKQLQDKCQSVLNGLLRDEDNKYCVDCDSKGPRWASWNIGVFLCIRCAGIHRNLGVHISKVKSVNLDTWTPEQVVSLQQMGNSRARAVYEANLPDNFRRPQNDLNLESFIRAKYEHKKYIAREWVPPAPPKVNWEKEIDDEIEKQKRKKKTVVEKKPLATVEVPQLPKPKNPSPKANRIVAAPKDNSGSGDLLGLQNGGEDSFSGFLSAAPEEHSQQKKKEDEEKLARSEEESFFNQTLPAEKEKVKMTKDSILALYTTPSQASNYSSMQPNSARDMARFGQGFNFGGLPQANLPAGAAPQVARGPVTNAWGAPPQFARHPSQNITEFQFYPQNPHLVGPDTYPNTFQQAPNHFGQFASFASQPQQQQQQQPQQQPNPFFANQSNLQQQFGNLSLNNQSANANATPPFATNIWQ